METSAASCWCLDYLRFGLSYHYQRKVLILLLLPCLMYLWKTLETIPDELCLCRHCTCICVSIWCIKTIFRTNTKHQRQKVKKVNGCKTALLLVFHCERLWTMNGCRPGCQPKSFQSNSYLCMEYRIFNVSVYLKIRILWTSCVDFLKPFIFSLYSHNLQMVMPPIISLVSQCASVICYIGKKKSFLRLIYLFRFQ